MVGESKDGSVRSLVMRRWRAVAVRAIRIRSGGRRAEDWEEERIEERNWGDGVGRFWELRAIVSWAVVGADILIEGWVLGLLVMIWW